ncbi:hypothetical protein LOTGIDRAFT_176665, partial [Lottia gigantea]
MEILRSSQISRQRRIIICSPRDSRDHLIRKILEKAKSFNLLSNKRQNFIFVDPSSYLEPFSGATQMYQLGLFSARAFLYAFRYIQPSFGQPSQDANRATSLDAAKITTMALNYYISTQTVLTNEFSDDRFLVAMKKVNIPFGETGVIRFNSTGQRIDYQLDLYTHGGENMYKKVADWVPSPKTANARMQWKRSNKVSHRTAEFDEAQKLEKISLQNVRMLLHQVEEVLGLWKVLVDHQFHVLAAALTKDQQNQLRSMTFKNLVINGRELCAALITCLITRFLQDNAKIDNISSILRNVCPNLYSTDDATCSMANELLHASKANQNQGEKQRQLYEALR